jgi:hypothetical protein
MTTFNYHTNILNIYQNWIELTNSNLSFEEWENEYYSTNGYSKHSNRIINEKKHIYARENMKDRLRKKLLEKQRKSNEA